MQGQLNNSHVICHTRMLPWDFTCVFALVRSPHSLSSGSDAIFLEGDGSGRTIYSDALASYDVLCSTGCTHNCRDTVLAGDDGSVGHHAAHFHDEASGGEEERRPARIGRRCNQDFTRFQASACGVEDDSRRGCDASG